MDVRLIFDLWRRLARLRARERWTRTQLESYQARAQQELRAYAYARSPFYQRSHRGLTDRPLAELPVLTKALMMEHFDELVTDRAVRLEGVREHIDRADPERRFLGRYWVCATSGSTGQPGLFLFDRAEWVAVLASFARAHEWAGLRVSLSHRMKMASVASTNPWHLSAQVAATLRSWWVAALRLDAAQPLELIVERLNAFRPEMLVAYASMAHVLADEQLQLAGRLRIAPHLIFTSSEVLTEQTRRRVEAAWGRPPFDQYGITEGGNLAAECERHAGMHLMEDLALVEVVDERNRPVPPGEYGEKVLVTLFASRTQPLIRYQVSDSLRLATSPCPCGRPFALVDDVQGRLEDVLHFPAAAGGEVAVHPNTFHHVLDTVPTSGWQVVQERDGALTVLLSGPAAGPDDAAVADAVASALAAQGARVPRVTVRRVSVVPKGAGGKVPLISSHRAGTVAALSAFGRPPQSLSGKRSGGRARLEGDVDTTKRWLPVVALTAGFAWACWRLRRVVADRRRGAAEGRWRRVQVSTGIRASPERVWAVITEPHKAFLTANPITRIELGSDQSAGVGTVYRWSFGLPFGGPRFAFDEVVTEWEAARRVSYQAISGWEMGATGELQPMPFGTRWAFTLDYRPPWPWSLLIPHLLEGLGIRLAASSLRRRAEAVEGRRGSPGEAVPVVEFEADIAAPPEEVFRVIGGPHSKRDWVPARRRVELRTAVRRV